MSRFVSLKCIGFDNFILIVSFWQYIFSPTNSCFLVSLQKCVLFWWDNLFLASSTVNWLAGCEMRGDLSLSGYTNLFVCSLLAWKCKLWGVLELMKDLKLTICDSVVSPGFIMNFRGQWRWLLRSSSGKYICICHLLLSGRRRGELVTTFFCLWLAIVSPGVKLTEGPSPLWAHDASRSYSTRVSPTKPANYLAASRWFQNESGKCRKGLLFLTAFISLWGKFKFYLENSKDRSMEDLFHIHILVSWWQRSQEQHVPRSLLESENEESFKLSGERKEGLFWISFFTELKMSRLTNFHVKFLSHE